MLQYGEVRELKIHCIPATALDAQLRITSMDMRIVNIVDGKLQGTGEGTVRIIISNSFDTIRKEITVTVQPPPKKHWWSYRAVRTARPACSGRSTNSAKKTCRLWALITGSGI